MLGLFVLMSASSSCRPRCFLAVPPIKEAPRNVDNASFIVTKTMRVRLRSREFDEQARDWRLERSPNQWLCTRFYCTQEGACLD